MLKLADLVDRDFEAFSMLDTLDMVPRSASPAAAASAPLHAAVLCRALHQHPWRDFAEFAAGNVFSYTLKEPVGVVGAITPWNAPLTSTIWKIGPVLATGCTMVVKPSEEASLTPLLLLGELILEAGFPPGVVNIVTGFGEPAGSALANHPGVDKIAFTGSDITGRKIIAASGVNIKRVTLELGGKSPDIVFADARLDDAVAGAGMGVFHNTGQICSAGTRILVERPIYEIFGNAWWILRPDCGWVTARAGRMPSIDEFEALPTFEMRASYLCYFFLFRRQFLLDVGGLDETVGDYPGIDDFDFIWTLLENDASVSIIQKALYHVRDHHGERLTLRNPATATANLFRIIRKHGIPEDEIPDIVRRHVKWYGKPVYQVLNEMDGAEKA